MNDAGPEAEKPVTRVGRLVIRRRPVPSSCIRGPGPGLDQGKRRAPAVGVGDFALRLPAEFLELRSGDQPQEPRLERHAELNGEAEVRMPRWKREYRGPYLR